MEMTQKLMCNFSSPRKNTFINKLLDLICSLLMSFKSVCVFLIFHHATRFSLRLEKQSRKNILMNKNLLSYEFSIAHRGKNVIYHSSNQAINFNTNYC